MAYLLVALVLYALVVTIICVYQRRALHAHEENWKSIEELSDHNRSGDVIIHVRPTEEK